MAYDALGLVAVGTRPLFEFKTEVEEFRVIQADERDELHGGRLACFATPYLRALSQVGSLNKTGLWVFHGTKAGGKATVQSRSQ